MRVRAELTMRKSEQPGVHHFTRGSVLSSKEKLWYLIKLWEANVVSSSVDLQAKEQSADANLHAAADGEDPHRMCSQTSTGSLVMSAQSNSTSRQFWVSTAGLFFFSGGMGGEWGEVIEIFTAHELECIR